MLCEEIHASLICPPHVSTSTAGNSEIAVSSSNEGGTAQACMPVHATGRAEECISLNGLKIDYLLTEKYLFPLVSYLSKAVKPHIRGRRLFKSTCAEICMELQTQLYRFDLRPFGPLLKLCSVRPHCIQAAKSKLPLSLRTPRVRPKWPRTLALSDETSAAHGRMQREAQGAGGRQDERAELHHQCLG